MDEACYLPYGSGVRLLTRTVETRDRLLARIREHGRVAPFRWGANYFSDKKEWPYYIHVTRTSAGSPLTADDTAYLRDLVARASTDGAPGSPSAPTPASTPMPVSPRPYDVAQADLEARDRALYRHVDERLGALDSSIATSVSSAVERLLDEMRATIRCLQREEIARLAEGDVEAAQKLMEEAEKSWQRQVDDLCGKNRDLEAKLASAGRRIADLERENETLLAERDLGAGNGHAAHESCSPHTLGELVQSVEKRHADALDVWSSAHKSAKECAAHRLEEPRRALEALAELAEAYSRESSAVGPLDGWFAARGLPYAMKETEQTMALYGSERVFRDGSREMCVQQHITLNPRDRANCVSIYFEILDEPDDRGIRRIAVVYCGKHLRNKLTNHARCGHG